MYQYNFYIRIEGYPEHDMVYSRSYPKDISRQKFDALSDHFLVDHILFFERWTNYTRKELFDKTSIIMFELVG